MTFAVRLILTEPVKNGRFRCNQANKESPSF